MRNPGSRIGAFGNQAAGAHPSEHFGVMMNRGMFFKIPRFVLAVAMVIGPFIMSIEQTHAANITCSFSMFKECAVIKIEGEIHPSDEYFFTKLTNNIRYAEVVLSGPGGDAGAAIQIGTITRQKRYNTTIDPSLGKTEICFSACALIWLAGIRRDIPPNTMLMFHTPYFENDAHNADGTATAQMGAYMRDLGFSYEDVALLIGHNPHAFHLSCVDGNHKFHAGDVDEKEFDRVVGGFGLDCRSLPIIPDIKG